MSGVSQPLNSAAPQVWERSTSSGSSHPRDQISSKRMDIEREFPKMFHCGSKSWGQQMPPTQISHSGPPTLASIIGVCLLVRRLWLLQIGFASFQDSFKGSCEASYKGSLKGSCKESLEGPVGLAAPLRACLRVPFSSLGLQEFCLRNRRA